MSYASSSKSKKIARILTVAGSDPSGGAGIQADIKTITSLGGYASSAITAITVQNTQKVFEIHQISGSLVKAQMEAVLDDIGADCIKIGMLGSIEVVDTVIKILNKYPHIPVVFDPVMVASSGDRLIEKDAIKLIEVLLLPLCNLVTPNILEALQLTGMDIKSLPDMVKAGNKLIEMGVKSALIKGAHMEGDELVNVLISKSGHYEFKSNRLKLNNTHGTGCTLSSALATFFAQGLPLEKAVEKAGIFVHNAILNAPNLGKGCGPLGYKF
jgi:hydroxymethylpyrimidine/phosphomethylpyrimidine kinase